MNMKVTKNSQTILEGNISLKSFLDAASSDKLEFTGQVTSRGNPLFTNGVTTLPIALGLLNYYIKQNLVIVDEGDNIICEKGWKIAEGTWTPRSRVQQEL